MTLRVHCLRGARGVVAQARAAPPLLTLQDPILLTPWLWFRGDFPDPIVGGPTHGCSARASSCGLSPPVCTTCSRSARRASIAAGCRWSASLFCSSACSCFGVLIVSVSDLLLSDMFLPAVNVSSAAYHLKPHT